jgi:hypothetical protein
LVEVNGAINPADGVCGPLSAQAVGMGSSKLSQASGVLRNPVVRARERLPRRESVVFDANQKTVVARKKR